MPARPELRGKKGPMNSTDTIVQEIVIHAPAERAWVAWWGWKPWCASS